MEAMKRRLKRPKYGGHEKKTREAERWRPRKED
jgi:hypothetical protein